jgi:hypothetical protein
MPDREPEVRLIRHARREAAIVLTVWALALAWVVGYCYLHGYRHDEDSAVVRWGLAEPRTADNLNLIAGFPDWVFVGIVVPWLLCTAFTLVFCFFMTDDDLGPPREGTLDEH